jgi:hypothetical protein
MAELSPFQLIFQSALGHGVARSLHVAAELGVADHLDEKPRSAREIAGAVGAHPESLRRVLRLLSDYGIFKREGDRFSNNAASQLLRADHPQSLRSYTRMIGMHWFWGSYLHMEHAVRSGEPVLGKVLPNGIWAHFGANPDEARIFNEAMTGKAHGQIAAVLANYDFSKFATIADIGGGHGHLLEAVLRAAPAAKGVLFDLPNVIEEAKGLASDRLTLQAGDFLKDKLPACDAYLIMEVIHDWNDTDSAAILSAVRRAAPAGAKLLLIEFMVPETSGPNGAALLDIAMMTLLGGKQRTKAEYEKLYKAAGFRLDRAIAAGFETSIIEGTAI